MDDDVVHVVFLYLGSEVDVDFDAVLRVLFLDGVQERVEPLSGTEVTNNPGEVDLRKSMRDTKRDKVRIFTFERRVGLEWLKLFMRYQMDLRILPGNSERLDKSEKRGNLRGKRRDTNTSTNKEDSFIIQEVLTSTSKWPVNHDTRESAVDRWIRVCAYNLTAGRRLIFLLGEVAANSQR